MKIIIIFAAVFLLFSSTTEACETTEIAFPTSKVCASLKWIVGPSLNVFNSVQVSLHPDSGFQKLELSHLHLNILPWMVMTGHEHGSRPVTISTILESDSSSEYLVEKLYFMGGMNGQWFLRFQLLDTNEILEEVRTLVNFN